MNFSLTGRQKLLIGVFLVFGITIGGVYITSEPDYEYDEATSDNVKSYSWDSEVTITRDEPYYNKPTTYTLETIGYLSYGFEKIYAVKTTPRGDQIFYTNQYIPEDEPKVQDGKDYRKVSFSEVQHWDVGQIPKDRAKNVRQINETTKEYTFEIERLSVSRDFVRNVTLPTDVEPKYTDKLTSRDWRTSGQITVQIKDYGEYKRVKQVKYNLSGKPLEGEESLTIEYKVEFDYSTDETPQNISKYF